MLVRRYGALEAADDALLSRLQEQYHRYVRQTECCMTTATSLVLRWARSAGKAISHVFEGDRAQLECNSA